MQRPASPASGRLWRNGKKGNQWPLTPTLSRGERVILRNPLSIRKVSFDYWSLPSPSPPKDACLLQAGDNSIRKKKKGTELFDLKRF
ncbi:MAG: hypothetical protein A2Z83_04715 [Omnitrophica bacterium GWA2_52_8]|nr:MAG: hypothetical protein A2Z83_04715 [Omnitrophica bacterium GWA2_52_8]